MSSSETPNPLLCQDIKAETTLWFDKAAEHYSESLPLGNGRLGMMLFGGTANDTVILNEESMWSGSSSDDNRENAHQNLPEIRELLQSGKNKEAQDLVMETFTCKGSGSGRGHGADVPFGCYQVMGTLLIKGQPTSDEASHYCRHLDLNRGVASLSYKQGAVTFLREYFVSAPDQLGVIRLNADAPGSLSFSLALTRPERYTTTAMANELVMTGQLNDGVTDTTGVRYCTRVRVVVSSGSVTADGDRLTIANADTAVILIDGETDYDGSVPRERKILDPVNETISVLDAAQAKGFESLLHDHIDDHIACMASSGLSLTAPSPAAIAAGCQPTNIRLGAFEENGDDLALIPLYFNYGRYLLIGSSRAGTLPANLQGIWAEEVQTPWNGDWHLDINVQMNYWLAEPCNLSAYHLPMLKLIESQQVPGGETAKAYYDAPGWVSHVITNAWGFTAPGEHASWGSTCSGSAWLCEHLWEHYLFTGDRDYLKWAYPIMKGSAEFYVSMLIEEPTNRWLVTAPSNSPENAFITNDKQVLNTCMGPTIDMQILRELFGNCIAASTILSTDSDFRNTLIDKRAGLAPNQIGPDGRLQEWLKPYNECEPTHRHVSHLYGLHPYNEITPDKTPELAEATRKSLNVRGDAGTGWSRAWKVNFWARLFDGDRAYKLLRALLQPADATKGVIMGNGGTAANLFCLHPPFQIDGNFGGTAGISEMLVQSRWTGIATDAPEILLLPALPSAWPSGTISQFKTRGGVMVDLQWDNGNLTKATLTTPEGIKPTLLYKATPLAVGDPRLEWK